MNRAFRRAVHDQSAPEWGSDEVDESLLSTGERLRLAARRQLGDSLAELRFMLGRGAKGPQGPKQSLSERTLLAFDALAEAIVRPNGRAVTVSAALSLAWLCLR